MRRVLIPAMTPPDPKKHRVSDPEDIVRKPSRFWIWAALIVGLGVPLFVLGRGVRMLFNFGASPPSLVPVPPDSPPARGFEFAIFLVMAAAPLLIYLAMHVKSRRRK